MDSISISMGFFNISSHLYGGFVQYLWTCPLFLWEHCLASPGIVTHLFWALSQFVWVLSHLYGGFVPASPALPPICMGTLVRHPRHCPLFVRGALSGVPRHCLLFLWGLWSRIPGIASYLYGNFGPVSPALSPFLGFV